MDDELMNGRRLSEATLRQKGIRLQTGKVHRIVVESRSLLVRWGPEDKRPWSAKGHTEPVIPCKYAKGSKIKLELTLQRCPAAAVGSIDSVRVCLEDRLGGTTGGWSKLKAHFNSRGKATISLAQHAILNDLESKVNQNLVKATVELKVGGTTLSAATPRLLHLILRKLFVFVPGVGGSRISVGGQEAFPEISLVTHQQATGGHITELACNSEGASLKQVSKLDLFRKFDFSDKGPKILPHIPLLGDSDVYTAVENPPAFKDPAGYPVLSCRGVRTPHFVVKAWPYDWRMHLEKCVDLLMGTGTTPELPPWPAWPPYKTPPSLKEIQAQCLALGKVQKTEERHTTGGQVNDFIDSKLGLIGHSTGGLIIRGALQRSGIQELVDRAYYIDVPFWGAPKIYYSFLSGDMIPFLSFDIMQKLAPNLPIFYYLAPTEQYPDAVAIDPEVTTGKLYLQLSPKQSAGTIMRKMIKKARENNDYPQDADWNDALEKAARDFHRQVAKPPLIGWDACKVFWSNNGQKDTHGPVTFGVSANLKRRPLGTVTYETTDGDGTVPVKSQKADFPKSCLFEIKSHPNHVPAPNRDEVWAKIVDTMSCSTGPQHGSLPAVAAADRGKRNLQHFTLQGREITPEGPEILAHDPFLKIGRAATDQRITYRTRYSWQVRTMPHDKRFVVDAWRELCREKPDSPWRETEGWQKQTLNPGTTPQPRPLIGPFKKMADYEDAFQDLGWTKVTTPQLAPFPATLRDITWLKNGEPLRQVSETEAGSVYGYRLIHHGFDKDPEARKSFALRLCTLIRQTKDIVSKTKLPGPSDWSQDTIEGAFKLPEVHDSPDREYSLEATCTFQGKKVSLFTKALRHRPVEGVRIAVFNSEAPEVEIPSQAGVVPWSDVKADTWPKLRLQAVAVGSGNDLGPVQADWHFSPQPTPEEAAFIATLSGESRETSFFKLLPPATPWDQAPKNLRFHLSIEMRGKCKHTAQVCLELTRRMAAIGIAKPEGKPLKRLALNKREHQTLHLFALDSEGHKLWRIKNCRWSFEGEAADDASNRHGSFFFKPELGSGRLTVTFGQHRAHLEVVC